MGPIDVNVPKIFVPSVPCPTNAPETPTAVLSAAKLPVQVTAAVVIIAEDWPTRAISIGERLRSLDRDFGVNGQDRREHEEPVRSNRRLWHQGEVGRARPDRREG